MWETLDKKLTENYDSCLVELPKEFALANGLSEKCFVSLTLRNGRLESEIIEYNSQDEKEVADFLLAFPNLNAELKHIGCSTLPHNFTKEMTSWTNLSHSARTPGNG